MNTVQQNSLANQLSLSNVLAFNSLFAEFYPNLCLYSNDITFNFEVSRDIVQDVFIKLWEKRETLPHFSDFKSYIYRSVKNKSFDYLKSLETKDKYSSYILNICKEDYNEEENLQAEELGKIIEKELNSLSDESRKVFLLSREENKKNREVAEILGVTVKNVEFHLSKIKKKLEKTIKSYFSD
jgi:RNA polymerase sigma-70 factor (ECF subfamily)